MVVWSIAFGEESVEADRAARFEREIRPVLATQCLKCHGEAKQEGGLRLDSLDAILKGGDSGPALVPGKPEESLLVDALHHQGLEMPPNKKLDDKTIARFEGWIEQGANWPQSSAPLRAVEQLISDEDREWWAFQPLRSPTPPIDPNDDWSTTPIDHFVWESLREKEMVPAPQADRATLIRRLYFVLVGLPPTRSEIAEFLKDESANSVETVIDRLLEDPRYGEHWSRFWLDLVRYSESDGWNQDAYRPLIWRYRDYVINAFNQDKPYAQFVRDQLAGDEMIENPEGMIASGFLRLGIYEYNQRDARGQWNDIMNEMTDVAGDVFLGMSMACARCHNHKFDPIPQNDYFKLRAFFEPVIWRDDLVAATEAQKKAYQEGLTRWESETKTLREELRALLEPYEKKKWFSTVDKFPLDIQACFYMMESDRTSWQEQMTYLVSRQFMEEAGGPYKGMKKEDEAKHKALLKQISDLDHLKPPPLPEIMGVRDFSGIVSPTVNPDDPRRRPIAPGFLDVLPAISVDTSSLREGTTGRRTMLAQWIGDPRNPLTNRVIVNRIWQQHFGQGLVATSSDFGHLGETPTHPALLDWLTRSFLDGGGSFKKLHKTILLSSTWQQSARHPAAQDYQQRDPKDRLLWRARVRRLSAEQIRDAMLVASGELSPEIGGPSVDEEVPRRSLYLKSMRNNTSNFLHGFDMATGLQSIAVRDSTTTPIQSLLLFNGKYAIKRSETMANRLLSEGNDPDHSINEAFRIAWGTEPSEIERNNARQFLGVTNGEESQSIDTHRFQDLCHILFNSNQFLYLE
jgi:hypothetical protein